MVGAQLGGVRAAIELGEQLGVDNNVDLYLSAKSFTGLHERVAFVPNVAGRIVLRVVDDGAWGCSRRVRSYHGRQWPSISSSQAIDGFGSLPNTWLMTMSEPVVIRLPPLVDPSEIVPGAVVVAGTARYWSVVRIDQVDADGRVNFVNVGAEDPAVAAIHSIGDSIIT